MKENLGTVGGVMYSVKYWYITDLVAESKVDIIHHLFVNYLFTRGIKLKPMEVVRGSSPSLGTGFIVAYVFELVQLKSSLTN